MRYEFYNYLNSYGTDNMIFYDIFKVKWSDFVFNSGYNTHYITDAESDRPDLISSLYYNSPFLIDVILLINGVYDILELKRGTMLKIPTLTDLENFKQKQLLPYIQQNSNELS
jgi:hypothetical protein